MSFISINLIRESTLPIISFQIPVLSQLQLQKRIQDFIKTKIHLQSRLEELNSHACKNLFQNFNCELFAFPSRALNLNSISCGDLYFSHLYNEKGIVLSFFPSREKPFVSSQTTVRTKFRGMNYPIFDSNSVATTSFPVSNISFLVFEEGTISKSIDENYTCKGLEISVLRSGNSLQTLFLRKENTNLLTQNPSLIRGGNITDPYDQGYILVNCHSKIKGFSFQAKFPVFTKKELSDKITAVRNVFEQNSFLRNDGKNYEMSNVNIFSKISILHHVVWFPPEMWIEAPYKGLQGGNLYFSYIEETENNGPLECVIISNLFLLGDWRASRIRHSISPWQLQNNVFFQTHLSTKKAFSCNNPHIKLIRNERSKEYSIKNAGIKFISSGRGIWGVCFSRENETCSEAQLQANEVTVDTHTGRSSDSVNPFHHESSQKEKTACLVNSQDTTLSDELFSTKKKSSQKTQKRSNKCLKVQHPIPDHPWTTHPQADASQWSMNMPHPSQSSLSQTSSWMINPQASSSQWSMNMPYTQSSSHSQPSLSQTSSWMINPQASSSQWSMNMPYTQSSSHSQSSLSQTSSWMITPQIGPSQGSMGIPYRQARNPPHAFMQMPPFYTGELSRQGALDFSQLTFEDVDKISPENWEKLNVILHDVSTESLLDSLKDAEND